MWWGRPSEPCSDGSIVCEISECASDVVYGCTYLTACNYDADATIDDGSCTFADDLFDCDGECLAEVDCVGVCGVQPPQTARAPAGKRPLDCAGICGGDTPIDCAGECGGTATIDCMGECGGPALVDCAGECGGSATTDCAGICGGSTPVDCAGECGGSTTTDCAGMCGGPLLLMSARLRWTRRLVALRLQWLLLDRRRLRG